MEGRVDAGHGRFDGDRRETGVDDAWAHRSGARLVSALLGDEDDLDGRDALNQRVVAAGDHGVVVDSVTVSVLL